MRHLRAVSKPSMPERAISILEKQAMTELVERSITQVLVIANFLSGLKESQP